MKLDINRAWTDAINLIQTNLSVVAVVAGVFFFLPYLAFVLFMPDVSAMGIESNPQDPTAAFNQVMALYADIWWMVALLTIAQTIGTLALLALLRAGNRPTVGQAIAIGAIGFLTSIAATIIFYIGFSVVAGLILGGRCDRADRDPRHRDFRRVRLHRDQAFAPGAGDRNREGL